MNDNDFKIDNQEKSTYHATSNLNTAIENPQINMNSAVGVNIKNVGANHILNNQFDELQMNNHSSLEEQNEQKLPDQMNQFQKMDSFYQSSFVDNLEKKEDLTDHSLGESTEFIASSSDTSTTFSTQLDGKKVVYAPTMEEKKKHNKKITISREFKVMLFIVFILMIFILVVPYIYDFFKQLELIITAR